MATKTKENISVKDAMDNLAAIVSIDLNAPGPIGIWKDSRLVVDEEEFRGTDLYWLSGEGAEAVLEILDATFRALTGHLEKLAKGPEMDWDNEKHLQEVAAIIALAGESAVKMERYLALRMDRQVEKIQQRPDFQALQECYTRYFLQKLDKEEVFEGGDEILTDVETVRRDGDYELFYIRKEDGTPYFNKQVVSRMRLSCDFESVSDTFEEDPLLQVRAMTDRDLQASAKQILGDCHTGIVEFYKIYAKHSDNQLASSLSMAVTALLLAGNTRNLLQNSAKKSCLQYFSDFHRFLRRAMKTPEYQKWIAYAPEKTEKMPHTLLHLTHALCDSFFHRLGGIKQESIGLIHRTMRRGNEKGKAAPKKGDGLWTQVSCDDENFRSFLGQFPNGPLFKIIDLIREEEEEDQIVPFDPIGQENFPGRLYELEASGRKIELLRIPSPTRQSSINKAELLDEFRGFLRSYQVARPHRRHLMIHLQDRFSWKEACRCKILESVQKNIEFSTAFGLLTLPKNSHFYHQNFEFLNCNKAMEFLNAFAQQIEHPLESGYFLPDSFSKEELKQFSNEALPLIHRCFFEEKAALTQRNREDFIELFYHLLILKLIDKLQLDSVSFTCKDAVDTGAALNASFFALVKMLGEDFADKKDLDQFRWLLYTPALFIRERAIDAEKFNRMLSCLEQFSLALEQDSKRVFKELETLYSKSFLKTLRVAPTARD